MDLVDCGWSNVKNDQISWASENSLVGPRVGITILLNQKVIILTFAVTIWTSAYTDQPVDFLESSITETKTSLLCSLCSYHL